MGSLHLRGSSYRGAAGCRLSAVGSRAHPPAKQVGWGPDSREPTALPTTIPVNDLNRMALFLEVLTEALGDGDAAMPPARAADSDGQIAFHLLPVLRKQIADELPQAAVELLILRLLPQVADDLRVHPGLRPQLGDEVGVREKANIEEKIEVVRLAVLESEADQRDEHRQIVPIEVEAPHHFRLQLMN